MSIPLIEPQSFFGIKTRIKGNAIFITDHQILYPVGGVLTLHDYTRDHQDYIQLDKKKEMNIICVSPNRSIVALTEKGNCATISLYDLSTLERIKGLVIPFSEITATEFVSIDFTFDGKYLVGIVGDPDWMLLCYNWEEGKVESSVTANNPNNPGPILQVSCNPSDNAVACVIGPGLFRLLNVSESTWRQFGWQKADNFLFTCVCWLSFDRCIAGTEDGRLVLVESGELKAIYKALEVVDIEMIFRDDDPPVTANINLMQTDKQALESGFEVRELTAFKKGFAFACGSRTLHVFEKELKSNHKFHKRNVFKIVTHEFRDNPTNDLNVIKNISINLSENTVLATTDLSQIYIASLNGPDINQLPEVEFKILGEKLHHGPVIGLAMCVWKPIFITIGGLDRTVRVWNYQKKKQDMIKQYQEDIFSVALHPTGLYVLLGFSDKLRLMILLIDDIQPSREFDVRNCPETSFSSNGHFFAATNHRDIHIYSTVSFQLVYNLKGHNGEIQSMKWTPLDNKLTSCGSEGGVYEWNMSDGQRVGECVTRSCPYRDVAVMSDGKLCYAVGDDGQIKEINNSMLRRGVQIINAPLDAILISRSDQMLFVAGGNGSIFSVNYPIIERAEIKEYRMHDRKITKMMMTYDDKTIVSASEDGTVCLWRLTFTDDKEVKMDPEFKHSTNTLISMEELTQKNVDIKELTNRLSELENEHSYVMTRTEKNHAEKMKEIQTNYEEALGRLQKKNKELTVEHKLEVNLLTTKMSENTEKHEQAMEKLEGRYNCTLINEYDKYKTLEESIEKLTQDYEKRLEVLAKTKQEVFDKMEEKYQSTVYDLETKLATLRNSIDVQSREHETIKQQIEDDADREIIEHRARFERLLSDEKVNNAKFRSEVGVMKNKFISSQKDTDMYKQQVITAQAEVQKTQQKIATLQKNIHDLKKEVIERDVMIEDKEKTIHELKKQKQQLDRYKFVLNYKITELANQINPKDEEIKEKKDHIREVEKELLEMKNANELLNQKILTEKEKIIAMKNQLEKEKEKNRHQLATLQRMRLDLSEAVDYVQEMPKLKQIIKDLHHKYNKPPEFFTSLVDYGEVQSEFSRQREHLESAVCSLKKRVERKTLSEQGERYRMLEENIMLVTEVNGLRTELQKAREELKNLNSIVKLNGKKIGPRDAKKRLTMATRAQHQIHAEYQEQLTDANKKIELLNQEVRRLIEKLSREEQLKHVREEKGHMIDRLSQDT